MELRLIYVTPLMNSSHVVCEFLVNEITYANALKKTTRNKFVLTLAPCV